jgi:hypothetical protein
MHRSSRMPCVCCQLGALFLLSDLLEACLTRDADEQILAREPGLDVLPMLRADGQKTIRAPLVRLGVARRAVQWFPLLPPR